jgi:hypothetical protein
MKSIRMKLLLFLLAVTIVAFWFGAAQAQQPGRTVVQVTLNFTDYDVIYLTDFIDVKSQKLSAAIPNISLDLEVEPPQDTVQVKIYVEVRIQLRGDPGLQTMVSGYTNVFTVNGRRTLTARDFAKGGSEISMLSSTEDEPLRKRMEDLAKTIPTAPPGTYQIMMKVLSSSSVEYGRATKTIVIPYSTPDEVFVEINDPKNGSYSNNLAPTFSWTTGATNVTVRVFEAGVNHRSPQDALTGGNPHLVKELTGVTTLTYPQDAARQLQENKAYVLQVEAKVSTSRGEMGNFSRPVVFRITDDKIGKMLDNYLNTLTGSASSTYSTLRSDPTNWVYWPPFGNITLNGSTLPESDLQTLLNELAGQTELKIELGIENQ